MVIDTDGQAVACHTEPVVDCVVGRAYRNGAAKFTVARADVGLCVFIAFVDVQRGEVCDGGPRVEFHELHGLGEA